MDNNFQIQVKKMQRLETTYVAFGKGTRMPFLTCDEDSFNDQIWVFAKEENAHEFEERRWDEHQDPIMVVGMEQEQMLGFYSSLYMLDVNEIVFVEEAQMTGIPLDTLIVKPDYLNLPKEEQPLTTPQLQLTGLYFMQELHRQKPNTEKPRLPELEEEMAANLVRSNFLIPIEILGKKILPDGSNVRLPCVKNPEDKMYQPIFTDYIEFQKFNTQGKFQVNIIEFINIDKIFGTNVEGAVVNPQGMNIVLDKNLIPNLIDRFSKG